jgi:hypothetical protein
MKKLLGSTQHHQHVDIDLADRTFILLSPVTLWSQPLNYLQVQVKFKIVFYNAPLTPYMLTLWNGTTHIKFARRFAEFSSYFSTTDYVLTVWNGRGKLTYIRRCYCCRRRPGCDCTMCNQAWHVNVHVG